LEVGGALRFRLEAEDRGRRAEGSEETLEVGGALRFRLEVEGKKSEVIRLRPTGYAATRRAGGSDVIRY
jgi:hypothetical protein